MRGTLAERFWAKVLKSEGCWMWAGAKGGRGYGHIGDQGKVRGAHRVAYEFAKGPIPKGLTIDHLCRQRDCCNPDHLEAVTNKVNILRGVGTGAKNARKAHCERGHRFSIENTYTPSKGGRGCRECRREYIRSYMARWRKTH